MTKRLPAGRQGLRNRSLNLLTLIHTGFVTETLPSIYLS